MERGNFEEAAYEEDDLMDPATVAAAGYEGLLNGDRIVIPGLENNSTPSSGAYSPGSST